MELNTTDNIDKGAKDSAAWAVKWSHERYVTKRRASFEIVDAYLNQSVGRLLDIRCKGTATNFIGVDGFEIVNVVSNAGGKKRATVEIKLL